MSAVLFDEPYFTGGALTSLTPHPWHVAIGGHPYMVDESLQPDLRAILFTQDSVPLLKDQQDASSEVSEHSLSPTGLWRRSNESWHLGAGQRRYDVSTSNEFRFLSSYMVNVWTEGQVTLLNGLQPAAFIGAPNEVTLVAGDFWYLGGGTALSYQTDPLNITFGSGVVVTGISSGNIVSMATDGLNVYAAAGSGGLYFTNTAITTASAYFTGSPNITLVGYAKGRLIVADNAGNLYNPVASGSALPTALLTTGAGAGFTWTSISDGPSAIYACGYKGSQGVVYAVTVKSDGTALNAPFVAGSLPVGELPRALYTYAGQVLIGTDKGVRVAVPDSTGSLVIGGLIPVGPVYDFEGQDRFVWFTWSNFAPGVGGLGRLDLRNFTAETIPAYASDLMFTSSTVTDTVTVRNVNTWQGRTVFTYEQSQPSPQTRLAVEALNAPNPVGWLTTGQISYGIVDPKVAAFVDVRHEPLISATVSTTATATVRADLAVDAGVYVNLGTSSKVGGSGSGYPMPANNVTGETFGIRLTLTSAGVDTPSPPVDALPGSYLFPTNINNGAAGSSPILHRVTLRALPQPTQISEFTVPILLRTSVQPETGAPRTVDCGYEYAYLLGLHQSQVPVLFQIGNLSRQVVVSGFKWLPESIGNGRQDWQGTFAATLRDVLP
jgi:hypothetical protein